jgi:hypothetical protein
MQHHSKHNLSKKKKSLGIWVQNKLENGEQIL